VVTPSMDFYSPPTYRTSLSATSSPDEASPLGLGCASVVCRIGPKTSRLTRAPCAPLRRLSWWSPLPVAYRGTLPSAARSHPRCPVPSSWVLTTSTACSTTRPAGLLHPASDPGVRLVLPRRTHPAKGSPLPAPSRCHQRSVLPCRLSGSFLPMSAQPRCRRCAHMSAPLLDPTAKA